MSSETAVALGEGYELVLNPIGGKVMDTQLGGVGEVVKADYGALNFGPISSSLFSV